MCNECKYMSSPHSIYCIHEDLSTYAHTDTYTHTHTQIRRQTQRSSGTCKAVENKSSLVDLKVRALVREEGGDERRHKHKYGCHDARSVVRQPLNRRDRRSLCSLGGGGGGGGG